MKKMLVIALVALTVIGNANASQICQTLVDNVNNKISADPNLCKIDPRNPRQTALCLSNKTCASACMKKYLGDDKFKTYVCPALIQTLNHNQINEIDKDLSNICPLIPKAIQSAGNKLLTMYNKALEDYNKETNTYYKVAKNVYRLALYAALTTASNIKKLADSSNVQDTCRSILRKQVVTAPETEAPLTFEEFEAAQEAAQPTMPVPPVPLAPPLTAEDIKAVVTKEATKIINENPQLTPQEQREVTSAIVEAVQEDISELGVPAAPPIGDLEQVIAGTVTSPSIKITPAAKKPVRQEVKQEAKVDIMDSLKAAMAERRKRIGMLRYLF